MRRRDRLCCCVLLGLAALASAAAGAQQDQPHGRRRFTLADLARDAGRLSRMVHAQVLGPKLLQLRFKWALLTYRLANAIFACKQLWRAATAPARRYQHTFVRQLSRHLRGRHVTKAQTQLLAQAACAVLLVAAAALLWRLLALLVRRMSSRRSMPRKTKRQ